MVKRCLETVSLRTLWPFASGMPSSTKQCSARESLNQFKKAGTKSWNMRALDPDFKPASSPDEEMTRNDKLLAVLAKLKAELPEVEKSLTSLSSKLGSAIPKDLTETLARLERSPGICARWIPTSSRPALPMRR